MKIFELRTKLYDQILNHSNKQDVRIAKLIFGGINFGKTVDFEILIVTKDRIKEIEMLTLMNSLYKDEEEPLQGLAVGKPDIEVNNISGNNPKNLISKVSRIDTECIWYNDPELTKNPITEKNLHKRQALIYLCELKTWDNFTCLLDSIMSFLDFSQCIYFYVTIAYEFFVMLT